MFNEKRAHLPTSRVRRGRTRLPRLYPSSPPTTSPERAFDASDGDAPKAAPRRHRGGSWRATGAPHASVSSRPCRATGGLPRRAAPRMKTDGGSDCLCGEEPPGSGYAVELMFAAIGELD